MDLWSCNGKVNQQWYWGQDGSLALGGHNVPGMCIDLPGNSQQNGNPLWIWGCDGSAGQSWTYDNQLVRLVANPQFCFDVAGGDLEDGTTIWLWECSGWDSQKWFMPTKSLNSAPKPKRGKQGKSPMHWVKQFLQRQPVNEFRSNISVDWVPWYDRPHVKAFHSTLSGQKPGFALPVIPSRLPWQYSSNATTPVVV